MKRRFERIQILLVIAISLLILAHPAYLRCARLSQTKFVSADLSFENSDQEERLLDSEKELKVFGSSAFLIIFRMGTRLFEKSSHLFFQTLPLHERIVVLRC